MKEKKTDMEERWNLSANQERMDLVGKGRDLEIRHHQNDLKRVVEAFVLQKRDKGKRQRGYYNDQTWVCIGKGRVPGLQGEESGGGGVDF